MDVTAEPTLYDRQVENLCFLRDIKSGLNEESHPVCRRGDHTATCTLRYTVRRM